MPPIQPISTGFVVAVVGFFSSFPILLQGLTAVGASEAQAASGLMFGALAMGVSGIILGLATRMPASVAWSTPGVALLAVIPAIEGGFGAAVGGFLIAGALTVLAGLWRPLSHLANLIPTTLAQAMLAGVLVSICIVPFQALAEAPFAAWPIVLTWFIAGLINRMIAVPAAVVTAIIVVFTLGEANGVLSGPILTSPVWTTPVFTLSAAINVGVPLFIVTMATQNIPGIAVLRSFGYAPNPQPMLTTVGLASVLTAPFAAPATCLAAITAAICASEDAHPDRDQRYWAAVVGGVFYCVFGLFAVLVTRVASAAPPMVLGTLAGVALMGVFASSARAALAEDASREAAAVTFLVTASGMTLFGLSAPVWGLGLGGIVYLIKTKTASR